MENQGLHPAGHSPSKSHPSQPRQTGKREKSCKSPKPAPSLEKAPFFFLLWLNLKVLLAWAEFGWEAEARLSGASRCEAIGLFAGVQILCKATAALVEFESIVALTENQLCFAGTRASSITTQQEVYKTVISCPVSALFFASTFYRLPVGFLLL